MPDFILSGDAPLNQAPTAAVAPSAAIFIAGLNASNGSIPQTNVTLDAGSAVPPGNVTISPVNSTVSEVPGSNTLKPGSNTTSPTPNTNTYTPPKNQAPFYEYSEGGSMWGGGNGSGTSDRPRTATPATPQPGKPVELKPDVSDVTRIVVSAVLFLLLMLFLYVMLKKTV